MAQVQHAPLGKHEVEIEVLAQAFPQLHGMLIQMGIGIEHVVGAHDRGVAPRVAAAEPAFFENRHIMDAMKFGQVISRRQPVPTAADDDDVIRRLGFRIAPRAGPPGMADQSLLDEAEDGIVGNVTCLQLGKSKAAVLSADDMTACLPFHHVIIGRTGKEHKQWLDPAVPEAINGRNNM